MATKEDGNGASDDPEGRLNRSVNTIMDCSFSVRKGQLIAVVGGVGSGKSSLLSALLGELNLLFGSVRLSGSVAYCDCDCDQRLHPGY